MKKAQALCGLMAVVWLGVSSIGSARAVHRPVTFWNNVAAQAVSVGRAGPPGLLDLAIVQAAVHDAVQAGSRSWPQYRSFPSGIERDLEPKNDSRLRVIAP